MLLRPLLFAFGLMFPASATLSETPPGAIPVQSSPAETAPDPATDPAVATLVDTMRMASIIEVMREEGLKYGQTLEDEMFPGAGGPRWRAIVANIYDGARMRQQFEQGLSRELAADPATLADIQAFFASDQGQSVLTLEIEARRALLDPVVEDAAKLAWQDMQSEEAPRAALLRRFAEVNDLIESNVMGALNSNFAFYQGLATVGAFPQNMTEQDMLADVWSQEEAVRAETEDWLFPFLALAYQPLSNAELEAYLAFSEGPAGQRINAALFAAFDDVFTSISRALGEAAARQMQGEDI